MQEAAKAAREKRAAEEAANPELKEKRLAEAKAKRDAKKAAKSESDDEKPKGPKGAGAGSDNDEAPKKRVSWWATATEEQKEAAKAKAKAAREAKKAAKPVQLTHQQREELLDEYDDDVLDGTTDAELIATKNRRAGRIVRPMPKN
jgi:hypothetical protein